VCRLPLATDTIKPKTKLRQRRSAANGTTDQRWRWWDEASEESNRRDDARAGVKNLFTVEAETAAVELTKCRLYTEEAITGTTLYKLPSECPDPVQNRMGTMPYAIWRTGMHLMNSSDRVNMEWAYTDRTTPTSADEEWRTNDDDQRRLIDGDGTARDRTNSR